MSWFYVLKANEIDSQEGKNISLFRLALACHCSGSAGNSSIVIGAFILTTMHAPQNGHLFIVSR